MTLLRPGLLEGRSAAVAGAVPEAVNGRLSSLGARLLTLGPQGLEDEDRLLEWAQSAAPVDALVCGSQALADIDGAWAVIRAVANGALIPAGAGAIVLVGPRPEAAAHAEAVRDALENLARTLSVEWARYGITATAVTPGSATTDGDLATLIAFLSSAAGGYLSGCRFELNSLA